MKKEKQHPMIPELQSQYQKGIISRRDFLRTVSLLGAGTAAYSMAGLTLSSCSAQANNTTFRWGMTLQELKDPANFNWVESSNVCRAVAEYLVEVDENNVSKPYLTERWEPSEDLKVWDFYLRPNVKFNNGDHLTSDDVIYNFKRWIDPNSQSINKTLFKNVTDLEKIDDLHFRIYLSQGQLSLPEDLYLYTTAIMHRDFDNKGADFSKDPVGTGPFTLEYFQVGDKAELKRRDDYWGTPANIAGATVLDLGSELVAYFNALKSNDIDFAHNLEREQAKLAANDPDLQILEANTNKTLCLRMKVTKPPFNDIRVRKAVIAAADNQALMQLGIQGEGVVAKNDHISPFHPEYAETPPQKQDITLAKRLLTEAGYPNGIDLELTVGNTQGKYEQDVCVALKEQCAPAGIRIKINVMPTAQYWEVWDKADFSATFWAHRPLGIMVYNLAYTTGAVWNETEFSNAKFDRKLKIANSIIDPNERSKVMKDLQLILQDNAIMVQPFWEKIKSVVRTNINGLKLHPTQYTRVDSITIEQA